MSDTKPSIFISYGRGDDHEDYNDPEKSFLRKLYNDLTDAGHQVWWDRESMPARGLTFLQEIQDAVTAYDKLILIVGDYAMQSDYVRAEWEYAQHICKPIIPLLLKGDYSLLPKSMANYHTPDFRETRSYELAIAELKRILDEPQPEPATTYSVPALPRGYIERDEFTNVRNVLLSDAISPTVTREEDQMIFIQGSGGIGKSTVASALSRLCEVRRRYPDGVIWITLGKNPLIAQKQGDIGVLFGDSRDHYQDPDTGKMHLKRILADKHVLIILDDVWSHKDVEPFMALGARCRMLITTRDYSLTLKIQGHEHDIEKLTETEGLSLLGTWQKRALSDDNPHEAEEREIIDILDGYTLAVAIAGAKLANKVAGYSHGSLIKRLKEGRTFKDLKLDDDDKNVNLEKSLYLSYVDLSPDDQKRFRQLGILAPNASFDAKLIGAIWEDEDAFETEDALNRLVSMALLEKEKDERWNQHIVLRAYGGALLEKEEESATFGQYTDYVIEIAEGFDRLRLEEWKQLDADLPHIDFIGDELTRLWEEETKRDDDLTRRAGDFVWRVQTYVNNRPIIRNTSQGRAYRGLEWLIMGVSIYCTLEQKDRQAATLNNIGSVNHVLGQLETAIVYYQQALPIIIELDNRSGEAAVLNNIGMIHKDLGQIQEALEYYDQALKISGEIGDRKGIATKLNNIGMVHHKMGQMQEALSYFEQALPIRREVGDSLGVATTLNNIGYIYMQSDELEKSANIFSQVILIMQNIDDVAGQATARNNLAGVYKKQGLLTEAIVQMKKSIELLQSKGLMSDAGGGTIEQMQVTLAQLKGEAASTEQVFTQLVGLYRARGEDGVREALSENPPDMIEQVMAEVMRRVDE